MVLPIIRDMNGRVIQDAEGPTAMDDPDVFDAFEEIERAFNDTMQRAFPGVHFVLEGAYTAPRIVQNFVEHSAKFLPSGTRIIIGTTSSWVSVAFPNWRMHQYTFEAIELDIVRWLDDLKSSTKEYHDAHAQASPANTEYEARRRALASVVPTPGARRLLLGRAKGPEGGEG